MAPPNTPNPQPEPNQPPKRETTPLSVPTVGVGKDQVKFFLLLMQHLSLIFYDCCPFRALVRCNFKTTKGSNLALGV